MNLAQQIAGAMADCNVERLPRLTRHAHPEFARNLLEAYYGLADQVRQWRELESPSWSVEERIAAATVAEKIEDAILHTRRWLSSCARSGGRGVAL